jgi:Spy/CpxP family protein refolding chaperone
MKYLAPLLLLAGLPLFAQAPRGGFFPWWDTPIVKDLNLSADQTTNIRSVVKEYRSKLIDLRAAVEKAEGDLEDQFNEESVDTHKANDAIDRLVAARAEMTKTISQMSLRLRGVLTADQWRELQKRRPSRQGNQSFRPGMTRQGMPPGGQPPSAPPGQPPPRP